MFGLKPVASGYTSEDRKKILIRNNKGVDDLMNIVDELMKLGYFQFLQKVFESFEKYEETKSICEEQLNKIWTEHVKLFVFVFVFTLYNPEWGCASLKACTEI